MTMTQTHPQSPDASQAANASTPPKVSMPPKAADVIAQAKSAEFVDDVSVLAQEAVPDGEVDERGFYNVKYDVPGKGEVVEAQVCRVRNGVSANYMEPYMRRRDPNCMAIADSQETDKPRFDDRFDFDFETTREETFDWLKAQDLVYFFFNAGLEGKGMPAMVICPRNAAFFAFGLGLLQGILSRDQLDDEFSPGATVYVAPTFRHTHFEGKQVVVHNRREGMHELYSYNLYPGPSAKKGVYGMLLNLGEREHWITAHCSTVQVITPYDNITTFMHEGASGGGKTEMTEHMARTEDGRVLFGRNIVDGETRHLTLPRGCELHPVVDDMALCHPSYQPHKRSSQDKLVLMDAENAWFLRVDHIADYGTDPHLEKLTIDAPTPLLFLNIDAEPSSTALIWEHIEDEPGVPCPNPRVIMPREHVPNIVKQPVEVDIRSFGVRCPPCTAENPTYGILGMFQILPPALAWLWRLVAPRGHGSPSIVDTGGMSSEGVGSYWPFATGRRVDQANLLLDQILGTTDTLFILIPNQHIGAWKVGFAAEWLCREYLARRGASPFRPEVTKPARCPLLGYTPKTIQVEGQIIGHWFLQVESQPEVGKDGYDAGAKQLGDFFHEQIRKFLDPDLDPRGRQIIEACLNGATTADYDAFTRSE